MNRFKFDLSFRIRHPQMDAEKICVQLGLEAKHKWTAGSQRKTPKGDLLEGTYDESYCTFPIDHDEETELADLIKSSTQSLKLCEHFLQLISSTGGRLEYFIGWYSSGNSGEEFDADLIAELANLGIGLSFDFYGGQ